MFRTVRDYSFLGNALEFKHFMVAKPAPLQKKASLRNGWPQEFRTTDQAAFVLRNLRMLPKPPQTSISVEAAQP